jgi:hypothetical protein
MRSVWNFTIVPGCILAAALLAGCGDDDDDCNLDGTTAPCPNPIYGWAQVNGYALTDDGMPVAGERVLVVCPDGVGASEGPTDAVGRFSVSLTYSVADTLLQPFPPRQPDGIFTVECQVSLVLAGDILGPGGLFQIPFGPTENDVVQSEVELRLPAEFTTR